MGASLVACFPFLIFIARHKIVDGYGMISLTFQGTTWFERDIGLKKEIWFQRNVICLLWMDCEECCLKKRKSNLLFSLAVKVIWKRKSNPLFSPLSALAPTHFLSLLPLNGACHTILPATWAILFAEVKIKRKRDKQEVKFKGKPSCKIK